MAGNARHVYKILTSVPPVPIPHDLIEVDTADGFIHLSTAQQVPATASRFFGNEQKLFIVTISLAKLEAGPGALKWEGSGTHGVFPHLYDADIQAESVVETKEYARAGGEKWGDVLKGLEE